MGSTTPSIPTSSIRTHSDDSRIYPRKLIDRGEYFYFWNFDRKNYNPSAHRPQKIRKFFAKIFLSKEDRKFQIERENDWNNYCLAVKGYELLIESKRQEFIANGYFDAIAESQPRLSAEKQLTITDKGKFEWVNKFKENPRSDYLPLVSKIVKSIEESEKRNHAES